ncbi:D-2-hydroxyacid dehydrogenase [Roseomonas sp. GC11]|uniref:D-2-hydroxyacid dehydrogenase n=1 Tax=Roseomonas sp. GC11 TaxID=2950546 RepID=UPI00210D3843|nr:D-2-hydroxyacid dehydrogenase [Roseomonas sp. GC11]MCQ4161808.1 D-2-hydroxyacid dehydrogenase [Roseomonas sp. GC11]
MSLIPAEPAILFAHPAYQMQARFAARATGLRAVQVTTREELAARVGEADVVVVSGLWSNALLEQAPRLRFVQSISAGVDQYDQAAFRARGVRLASAQGVNANAVSEHALALILAMARLLPQARDNQKNRHWRPMIGEIAQREDELGGKTLVVVGLGRIGGRLARLAKAFGMHVVGLRRDPAAGADGADEVHAIAQLHAVLPRADIVALTCPLTPETTGLIGAAALAAMKPTARLVNVARGRVVDEAALVEVLRAGGIAGAALDVTVEEPLPAASPLWDMPNVLITPHSAGETQRYEDNVLDILMDNLARLQRGEDTLRNQVV